MPRLRKKEPRKEGILQTIKRSTTYTNLLDSIMPFSSRHNAAKVAQTLGTPTPENAASSTVASLPLASTVGTLSDVWTGPEVETEEADDAVESMCRDAMESRASLLSVVIFWGYTLLTSPYTTGTTALYHDAIRPICTNQQASTIAIDPALATNRNCSVDIYNLPDGTTLSQVLAAIAHHRPVGEIYKCDLLQVVGPATGSTSTSSILSVARVRFKSPASASLLFQIGCSSQTTTTTAGGSGLYVRGERVGVRFTRLATSAYVGGGTRVVVFRGPGAVVNGENLRRVWGGTFLLDRVERVTTGSVGLGGIQEVEWRFFEFAWGAQVAKCLFEDVYGRRGDCSAWYGEDPCT